MYNGYENYETWNVVLWCSNDEIIYNLIVTNQHIQEYSAERTAELVFLLFPEGTPDVPIHDFIKINWDEITIAFNDL